MKANVIFRNGEADQVFGIIDLPKPKLGKDEVLIKVEYTSVNPLDCRIRSIPSSQRAFPVTLGFDVYGEIAGKGPGVADLNLGDNVIASPSPFLPGANAEYVVVKAMMCLKVSGLDPKIGAAIPLVGITAYEALFDKLKIKSKDTVLIHAGAGGVGHIAIQLAKIVGCTVITTASRPNSIEFCKEQLKADHVINYKKENTGEAIQKITNGMGIGLILDTVGGDTFHQSINYLNPGGHICTILPIHLTREQGYQNLLKCHTISFEYMGVSGAKGRHRIILNELVRLIEAKKLIPKISREYRFDEIHLAHQEIEKAHTIGKIIIRNAL